MARLPQEAAPDWQGPLLRLTSDPAWSSLLADPARAVHLAVMLEPWLSLVLSGRKTVESRFGKHPVPPYGTVTPGDIIVFKRSSGPVLALALAVGVRYAGLSPDPASARGDLAGLRTTVPISPTPRPPRPVYSRGPGFTLTPR